MNALRHPRLWPVRAPPGSFSKVAAASALLAALPPLAHAQLSSTIYGLGQYQYDSNVFDLQRGFPSAPHDYSQADRYFAYGAGLDLNYQASQQNFYLHGSLTQYHYDHFSDLTHSEYTAGGGWRWKLGDDVSGTFDVSRARTMVPFVEIITVSMVISTDQRQTASLDYQFIPTWHLTADAYTDRLQEPLPGEPHLNLLDSGGDGSIRFRGGAGVTGGFTLGYQHGSYSNAIVFHNLSYNQWTYGLVGAYQPSGPGSPTLVDSGLGYTSRSSPAGVDDVSGWTGHLALNRALTGKTSIRAALLRDVSSYVTNAGAEIDTSAAISARWQATYKSGFDVGYTWLYSVFPNQGFIPGTTRHDHLQFATFTINYAAEPWLIVRPYADFQTRSSDYYGGNFNASIFGVLFLVQWQTGAAAGPAAGPNLVPGLGPAGAPTGVPAAVLP